MEKTMKLGSPMLLESSKSLDCCNSSLSWDFVLTVNTKDPQMVESLLTEWTDEKHNLYLNSIEASFVKQLYNPDNLLRDLHVWSSRRQKVLAPNSPQSNSNENLSANQYKVLRRGCWEEINCERTRTRPNYGNESCLLLKNQFIQHSSPASVAKDLKLKVTARDIPQHGKLVSDVVHFGGQKYRRAVFGLGTSSKQQSPCDPALCRQDSVGSNTEVSDQNFVEEDFDSTSLSRSHKKRHRAAAADVSSRDQRVPMDATSRRKMNIAVTSNLRT